VIARVLVLLVAILFAAPAFALSGVFRDGFESGDDRYWTGPLETCRAPDDDPRRFARDRWMSNRGSSSARSGPFAATTSARPSTRAEATASSYGSTDSRAGRGGWRAVSVVPFRHDESTRAGP